MPTTYESIRNEFRIKRKYNQAAYVGKGILQKSINRQQINKDEMCMNWELNKAKSSCKFAYIGRHNVVILGRVQEKYFWKLFVHDNKM